MPLRVAVACTLALLLGCDGGTGTAVATLADAGQASSGDGAASGPDADARSRARQVPDAGAVTAVDSGPAPVLERRSLIDHHRWQRVSPQQDASEDRPSEVRCEQQATIVETLADELALEVDTTYCNYLAVHQRTRVPVSAGETLQVRLWHFSLSAAQPAQAHAMLQVGGARVLDERVPIPAEGGLLTASLQVEQAIPEGAPVYFHLHNHGDNTWALVEVSAGP